MRSRSPRARNAVFALLLLAACGGKVSGGNFTPGDDGDTQSDGGSLPINQAPDATQPAAVILDEDTSVAVTLRGTDSEDAEAQLTVTVTQNPAHGALDVTSGTSPLVVHYTPTANFAGADSLTFTVTDSGSETSVALVVGITVSPIADAPVTGDDGVGTDEDTEVIIDVLANDSDVDGNSLTVQSVGTPSSGGAVIANNKITFTPATNANGIATFSYVVADGTGLTANGQVTVTVAAVNDRPVCTAVAPVTLDEDTNSGVLQLTGTDVEDAESSLDVLVLTLPKHGVVDDTSGAAPHSVTYTPNPNYHGTDSFTFYMRDVDNENSFNGCFVSFTITPVSDPPQATDDDGWTAVDTARTFRVLANDVDPDDDTLSIAGTTTPSNGSVTNNGTTVTYTPGAGFSGTDSFTYTVSDGTTTDTGTVTVRVVTDGWQDLDNSGNYATGGISKDSISSIAPAIAVDAMGVPIVAWMANTATDYEIYVRRWNRQTSTWVELAGSASSGGMSNNNGASGNPTIAFDNHQRPIIAWADDSFFGSPHIWVRRYNGVAWEVMNSNGSGMLSTGVSHNAGPKIACDDQGRCTVAWVGTPTTAAGDTEIYLRQWRPDTEDWNPLGSVSTQNVSNTAVGDSTSPRLVLDANGDPIVAWVDDAPSAQEVYLRRWSSLSGWQALTGSASGNGITGPYGFFINTPGLAFSGTAPFVAWGELDGATGDTNVFGRAWTSGGGWGSVGTSGSAGGVSQTANATYPLAVTDPQGRPIMAWIDASDGDTEIYTRRWNGSNWVEYPTAGSASGGGVSNNALGAFAHDLAVGADGTVCVAWWEIVSSNSEVLVRCTP